MKKQEGVLVLTGFRERYPDNEEHVLVRPFDATETFHTRGRWVARWTDGAKPPSEPMRIVDAEGLRVLLRPLRFFERWALKLLGVK